MGRQFNLYATNQDVPLLLGLGERIGLTLYADGYLKPTLRRIPSGGIDNSILEDRCGPIFRMFYMETQSIDESLLYGLKSGCYGFDQSRALCVQLDMATLADGVAYAGRFYYGRPFGDFEGDEAAFVKKQEALFRLAKKTLKKIPTPHFPSYVAPDCWERFVAGDVVLYPGPRGPKFWPELVIRYEDIAKKL